MSEKVEDPKIARVIDLIANLERHDPVAPVQVWVDGGIEPLDVHLVFQATPSYIRDHRLADPRPDGEGAYPVVIVAE